MSNQTCNVRRLAPREQQVLKLIGQYYTYDSIAAIMGIRKRTLHKYIELICKKIGLHTEIGRRIQNELVRYAQANGYAADIAS